MIRAVHHRNGLLKACGTGLNYTLWTGTRHALWPMKVPFKYRILSPDKPDGRIVMKKMIVLTVITLFIAFFVYSGAMAGDSECMMDEEGMKMMAGHDTRRVSKLLGSRVVSHKNEEVGRVADLIISEDGKISYLILSRGGVMGMGVSLVPIPFSLIETGRFEKGRLTVNIDRQAIEMAPSFASNAWPSFSDPGWRDEVRGYFGSGTSGRQKESGMHGDMEELPNVY